MKYPKIFAHVLISITATSLLLYLNQHIQNEDNSNRNTPKKELTLQQETPVNSSSELGHPTATTEDTGISKWLKSWEQATSDELLQQGIQIARNRRDRMQSLIRSNPGEAIDQMLSYSQYLKLPDELAEIIEKPFAVTADVEKSAYCTIGRPLRNRSQVIVSVVLDGTRYSLNIPEERQGILSKKNTPVIGIRLGSEAALHRRPTLELSSTETQAAARLFQIPTEENNSEQTNILIGDSLFAKDDLEAFGSVNERLIEAETRPSPHSVESALAFFKGELPNVSSLSEVLDASDFNWTESPKSILLIRAEFKGDTKTVAPKASTQNNLEIVSDRLSEMSYGHSWLSTIVVTEEIFETPEFSNFYNSDFNSNTLHDHIVEIAQENGYITSDYDIVGVIFPRTTQFSWSGLASIGGSMLLINGSPSTYVLTHEIGHTYGLGHASSWNANDESILPASGQGSPNGTSAHVEYGDIFDTMGGSNTSLSDFSANGKYYLNWIQDYQVENINSAGIRNLRIYPFDEVDSHRHPLLAANVEFRDSEDIWIAYRRNSSNAGEAYITWRFSSSTHRLLDMNPDTNYSNSLDMADATLAVGQTFSDPNGFFEIKNIETGPDDQWIDIQIETFGTTQPVATLSINSLPIARELVEFEIDIENPGDENFRILWGPEELREETISGTPPKARFRFPTKGEYKITATISNSEGLSVQDSMTVTVTDPIYPWTLQSLGYDCDFTDILYNDGLFYALCGDKLFRSIDGMEWFVTELPIWGMNISNPGRPIEYVIVGSTQQPNGSNAQGAMASSSNGIDWEIEELPEPVPLLHSYVRSSHTRFNEDQTERTIANNEWAAGENGTVIVKSQLIEEEYIDNEYITKAISNSDWKFNDVDTSETINFLYSNDSSSILAASRTGALFSSDLIDSQTLSEWTPQVLESPQTHSIESINGLSIDNRRWPYKLNISSSDFYRIIPSSIKPSEALKVVKVTDNPQNSQTSESAYYSLRNDGKDFGLSFFTIKEWDEIGQNWNINDFISITLTSDVENKKLISNEELFFHNAVAFGSGRFVAVGDNSTIRTSGRITTSPNPLLEIVGTEQATINNSTSLTAHTDKLAKANLKYFWDKGDGVLISGSKCENFLWENPGSYEVRCFISDEYGGYATAEKIITVTPLGDPVVKISGTLSVFVRETSTLTAIDQNMDTDSVNYDWSINSESVQSNASTLDFSPPEAGKYSITVSIEDKDGLTATTTVSLNAIDPNSMPTIEDVIYYNDTFIAVGAYSYLSSEDGNAWDSTLTRIEGHRVSAHGEQRIVVGLTREPEDQVEIGAVAYSSDEGKTWTREQLPEDTPPIIGIARGVNCWIATAEIGKILRRDDSTGLWDPIVYTLPPNRFGEYVDIFGINTFLEEVAFGLDTFIIKMIVDGYTSLLKSVDDGLTWTQHSYEVSGVPFLGLDHYLSDIRSGDFGGFLLSGNYVLDMPSIELTSSNGIMTSRKKFETSLGPYSKVASSGGVYYTVSTFKNPITGKLTNYDHISWGDNTWSTAFLNTDDRINAVAMGSDKILVFGENGFQKTISIHQSDYDLWIRSFLPHYSFEQRLDFSDPDQDTLPNIIEYIFQEDPDSASNINFLDLNFNKNGQVSSFQLQQQSFDPNIELAYSLSSNLIDWEKLELSFNTSIQEWSLENPNLILGNSEENGDGLWDINIIPPSRERTYLKIEASDSSN
ncbi:hypothetical protein MLD52_18610 [Puniceicoccaceae bacterium K14]|nr:hypothetical protein [Puniceicoccaceae bacterium K14]